MRISDWSSDVCSSDLGAGYVCKRIRQFEIAVGTIATGVNDTLGDALMIEMEDLFAEMKILHQRRSARALAQGVLVISDGRALLGGQRLGAIGSNLMRFAASPLGFSSEESRVGKEGVSTVRSRWA